MSILDRFTGGDDPVDEEQLADLREWCEAIVDHLRDNHFSAETRTRLARRVREVEETGVEVTTASVQAPVPENSPSTATLADCMEDLAAGLTAEQLEPDATSGDAERLAGELEELDDEIVDADGFGYEYDEVDVENRHGKPVIAEGMREGDTELYAGPYARELMENAQDEPDQPLWMGLGTRDGRDAAVRKQFLFRHMGIFGVTGYGKSTLLKNSFYQLAAAGYGGCFIDPKGDDSVELMELLPEERMDDVIWIEPGSSRDHISGFNFLDIGLSPDHPHYDTAVEALVDDLKKLLQADNYWGARMDRVTQNLIRAMHESRYDFTLIDMYYVLKDEESRRQFADLVAEEGLDFVREYTETIAEELEDDDLEPLLGRFQPWVENKLARRMVAFRDSGVDIPKAVEEGKIIIVRMGAEDKGLKRMLGMAVIRRIWASVRARADMSEEEREPFFLFADEFDNIALNDETVPTMLSEARSYRLSLTFCCQYPGQLPDNVVEGMLVNCDTIVSFNPGSKKQARYIAPKLDLDEQDLMNEVNYHVWMRVTLNRTMEKSDAFRVYTYPPYPPVRTEADASEFIDHSLEQYGRPTKSKEELKGELLFNHGRGMLEGGEDSQAAQLIDAMDGDDDATPAPTPGTAGDDEETAMEAVLEGIFAARLQAGLDPGGFVPVDDVRGEVERRVGDTGYVSKLSNVIEQVPDEAIEREQRSGELHLALTDRGRTLVFDQDTGSSASGGGEDHRWVLREAYRAFSGLGYLTTLPTQEGEEVPDGVAEVPIDPAEGDTIKEIERRRERLYEEYPHVWGLSEGKNVTIEAETSTPKKPTQPIVNMRKAVDRGDVCVFACRDGTAAEDDFAYWAKRIERVLYHAEHTGRDMAVDRSKFILAKRETEDGRQFYNTREDYELDDDVWGLRPTGNSRVPVRWVDTGEEIVVEDNESGTFATFDSVEDAVEGDRTAVPAYYEYRADEDEYVLYHDGDKRHYASEGEILDEWSRFKAPYVPEADFETPIEEVSEDDFVFVVFPDDDNDRYDGPQVYEDGEVVSLDAYTDPERDAIEEAHQEDTEQSPGGDATATDADASAATGGTESTDSDPTASAGATGAADVDGGDAPAEPASARSRGADSDGDGSGATAGRPPTAGRASPDEGDATGAVADTSTATAGEDGSEWTDCDTTPEEEDVLFLCGGPEPGEETGLSGPDQQVTATDGGHDLGLAHGGLFESGPDLSLRTGPTTDATTDAPGDPTAGPAGASDVTASTRDTGRDPTPGEAASTGDETVTGGTADGPASATEDRGDGKESVAAETDTDTSADADTDEESPDDATDDPAEEFFDAFGD